MDLQLKIFKERRSLKLHCNTGTKRAQILHVGSFLGLYSRYILLEAIQPLKFGVNIDLPKQEDLEVAMDTRFINDQEMGGQAKTLGH